MTPQFLREEAARFRGMADTAEREASKQRLLKMAADYESQAKAADELPKPNLPEPDMTEPNLPEPNLPGPNITEAIKVKAGRKIAREPNGAV
jgi:hypothetical protein